jgi:hypothetical protein
MFCIYCGKQKPPDEFSLEHIIPQFMGGSSECPDTVTREVCRRYNNLCGRYVDAPVARGFFQNASESNSWKYCFNYDAAGGNVYPLLYFGASQELDLDDDEEAELWLAPDGGTVWHIHQRRSFEADTMAGGDPVAGRKEKTGRVYSFNASQHPYWMMSNFKSVVARFKNSPIFLGADSNIEAHLPTHRSSGAFCKKDAVAIAERDAIVSLLNQKRPLWSQVKLDMLFDIRFLAKLALGFGHKLLGQSFEELEYTKRLRSVLWARRETLQSIEAPVRMQTYFGGLNDLSHSMLAVPGGLLFTVVGLREGLVLSIVFPSGRRVQVSITDPSVDAKSSDIVAGISDRVFVSVPQLNSTVGPKSLLEYIAWKRKTLPWPDLDNVFGAIMDRSALPPLR